MDQLVAGSEYKVCKQVIASLVPYMYASLAFRNFVVCSCNPGQLWPLSIVPSNISCTHYLRLD